MKTKSKAVILALSAVLLVAATFFATMAYLTSQDEAVNTFTIGKIAISLDETDVDIDGKEIIGSSRVKTNDYKLMPGHEYKKDPTVHILPESEPSYLRMLVTVNNVNALKAAMPKDSTEFASYYQGDLFLLEKLVTGWDPSVWNSYGYTSTVSGTIEKGVYEFRYFETKGNSTSDEIDLDALFDTIKMPGSLNNTALSYLEGVSIDVTAQAIQADGFDTADDAWSAFN